MATTIANVRALGYEVGFAQGSVAVEEDALEAARQATGEAAIEAEAATVAVAVAKTAASLKMPKDEMASLVMRVTSEAVAAITESRNEAVAFHQRALAIAKEMPDVYFVSGFGLGVYVSCSPDGSGFDEESQAILDALCDPDAHRGRSFQHHAPDDVVSAVLELRQAGETIEAEADEAGFKVKIAGKVHTKADPVVAEADARREA